MEGIGILLKGHAHLTRENVLGQRTIMTDLTPSAMFGEAILFTDMPNWPATIQTTLDSTVLFFAKIGFHHIIQQLRCLPGADSNQFVA